MACDFLAKSKNNSTGVHWSKNEKSQKASKNKMGLDAFRNELTKFGNNDS